MELGHQKPEGGLKALLDFGFTEFVTLGVVEMLYLLGLGLVILEFLIALVASFLLGFGFVVGVLIVGPVVAVLQLLCLRIWLELVVVLFRIAENTRRMVELMGGQPSNQGTDP